MNDRIPLDHLTSDALDALYERLEAAEETETQRQLATVREAFAAATVRAARAEAAITRALTAIHIADDEDVTDWQRGYRACATNARRALDDPTPDTAATQATRPREHCGHLKPQFFPSSKTTECVLHPGHPGSHADDHGCRWQPITEEHPTPAITTGLVVQPYRADDGTPKWVFRCWGTDTCDGWLSLDHYNQQSAERARDRHVAESHTEEQPHA